MKKLIFFITILILSSCTSTARRKFRDASTTLEKVVILECPTVSTELYKVKRISQGVVTFVKLPNQYMVKDTILYRFEVE